MNDRLKFRVWSKKSKRYTGNNASYSIDESGLLHVHIFGQHYELGNTEDFEVEQCTGLKDKNGNLIYEGDIVLLVANRGYHNDKGKKYVIEFGIFRFCGFGYRVKENYEVEYALTQAASKKMIVVGNIHERKEEK